MKKLCIILLLTIYLVGMAIHVFVFFIPYIGWQYVSIPNVGSFKIPGDWFVTKKGYIVYITDKSIENEDCKVYLTGSIWSEKKDNDYDSELNKLFGNVVYIKGISGAIFSNNAEYSLREYIINDNKENKYSIYMSNFEHGIDFIVWDNSIAEDIVKRIAKSYERDRKTKA